MEMHLSITSYKRSIQLLCQNGLSVCHFHVILKWPRCMSYRMIHSVVMPKWSLYVIYNGLFTCYTKMALMYVIQTDPFIWHAKIV